MKIEYKSTFGVAGNFTGHLEQAGEAVDFKNIKTAEAIAPKAIFPTFLKMDNPAKVIPEYLTVNPFDSQKILFPKGESKLQIECECVIACKVQWQDKLITKITPYAFAASNDCSIRKEGAKKISEKKNWGESSKGYSDNFIPLAENDFTSGSILDKYRIAGFLVRDNQIIDYGENSAIKDYSYIYEKLINWMIDKFNNQQCEGPAEDLHSYLLEQNCPEEILVSIGATRYTQWGQENFLAEKDLAVVVIYPEDKYSVDEIKTFISQKNYEKKDISFLVQEVILQK